MAGVGGQTDPVQQEVSPADQPPLHLLLCTVCRRKPMKCRCSTRKRTADGQHVTSPGWTRVRVHTADEIAAAAEETGTNVGDLLERLAVVPEPPRRVGRDRPSTARRKGRLLA